MKLVSPEKFRRRLEKRNLEVDDTYKRLFKPKKPRLPRRLKHNAGDGGDYAKTYMSDYGKMY